MDRTGTYPTTPSYLHLLGRAYDLGRADGAFAADVEPVADPGPPVSCCRGRDADGFARHLWEGRPGVPPAGLIANAPAWYGQGFREALAEARTPGPGTTELPVRPAAHPRTTP